MLYNDKYSTFLSKLHILLDRFVFMLTITVKLFVKGGLTTTPVCQMSEGMNSPTTIPSSEIKVNDNTAIVENLRPNAISPMMSYWPSLVIEYTPSSPKPVQMVKLVSTANIKTYNVTFFNADRTVTTKTVCI